MRLKKHKCILCKKQDANVHIGVDRTEQYYFCLDCLKVDGTVSDLITMAKQMPKKKYIDGIG